MTQSTKEKTNRLFQTSYGRMCNNTRNDWLFPKDAYCSQNNEMRGTQQSGKVEDEYMNRGPAANANFAPNG